MSRWKPNSAPPRKLIAAVQTPADVLTRQRQTGEWPRHAQGTARAMALAELLTFGWLLRKGRVRVNPNIEAEIEEKRRILLPQGKV